MIHPLPADRMVEVAVFAPLRRTFHYLLPDRQRIDSIQAGLRVRVPFGKGFRYGVILGMVSQSAVETHHLKPLGEILDQTPLLSQPLRHLLDFAAQYYHHPIGEVWSTALPTLLRKGSPLCAPEQAWRLTASGREQYRQGLHRAPRQHALLHYLDSTGRACDEGEIGQHMGRDWRSILAKCLGKGWIETATREQAPAAIAPPELALTHEQSQAVAAIQSSRDFAVHLLDGVTGSGKTLVYLESIAPLLVAGKQALVLVPDISLTPQLLARFTARFGKHRIAALHSGLSDTQRLAIWCQAQRGELAVIIGTRSALFTPLARPGILIIDEEHDASLKQQDGLRYSARDLAIVRARSENIPIVLGSATPSLESLHNALSGRYRYLRLDQRAPGAELPQMQILDIRRQPLQSGVSMPLMRALLDTLERGEQALLFINRRGYAPAILCHECGWVAYCTRCSAPLTLHRSARRLRCHHCGSERRIPEQCGSPACGSPQLLPIGNGTEQVEAYLRAHLPAEIPLQRIDRDALRRKGSLEAAITQIHKGGPQVLVGTQMLAKGHHFPNVTLVGVLNADNGLFSPDFRAQERLLALVLQVAGRAGRADKAGTVLVQTHHPEHPLMTALARLDYRDYARHLLAERNAARLPPYQHVALLHAEAHHQEECFAFLREARQQMPTNDLQIHGPLPSPMERRLGRYRAQLWLQSPHRETMIRLLEPWVAALERIPSGRRVRWALDVDPLDML